ncbi:MAG: hypothetical protein HY730_05680 [Candidatus Tectomicrobia bacterium]|uniref:Uncharacterized protein n=1 Tax=Tectimicrobiota bacterium TaxID=2528274 RepID=A0A933GN95_UNCTE|nr:hypothetical protein [Candidatus Tectomicrobia bacterium]
MRTTIEEWLIQCKKALTRLKQMLTGYEELKRKIEAMEQKYDEHSRIVFEATKQLLEPGKKGVKKIGF